MRRAAKIDANQPAIIAALRRCGCRVRSTAQLGDGFPDLLVGYRGELSLLEVKDGSKPPSQQRLTDKERAFHDEWAGFPVFVVGSVDEALTAVGVGPIESYWEG